jgi:two-component system sensor histidine kinase/response regulator
MTKIMVIEDETLLRQEVVDWLTFEGYEAAGVEDGLAGVEAALHDLPDLIISDITMPRLDGYGVLLELHSNPLTADIPFIFVTARAAHEDIRKGMASGADDYITKPFTRRELLDAIQSRLNKQLERDQEHKNEIDHLQQALTQERELRLLKARLVGMFSHDFRNPLTSILSSSTLLRDYADRMDEKRRLTHISHIISSVRQLTQMLDDMLLVAQMDSGNLDFAPTMYSPEQIFHRVVEEFQTISGETHQVTFESHFPNYVLVDPRLLRPIASNLISNAIKYSPKGSDVRVTLDSLNDNFNLTVQDQGIGIPEEDQGRLFAAFQRGSNVNDVKGTGLGLAIVKQAVDLHGGSIQFESYENVGTTMRVMIPIRLAS